MIYFDSFFPQEQCKIALEKYKSDLDSWSQTRVQIITKEFEETSQNLQEYGSLEEHLSSVASLLGK